MNKCIWKKVACVGVFFSFAAIANADESYESFGSEANSPVYDIVDDYNQLPEELRAIQSIDQSVCYFKTAAKDPFVTIYSPGENQVKIRMCGTKLPGCVPTRVKGATDLQNLVVIHDRLFDFVNNVQIERRFEGYSESWIQRSGESIGRSVGFLSSKPYSGKILVDEYRAGMPMRWTVVNNAELSAVMDYLENGLGDIAVSKKPLMVLQLTQAGQELSTVNRLRVERYFTLIDYNDAAIKPYFDMVSAFYNNEQVGLMTALSRYSKDTPVVKQEMGDIIYYGATKLFKDFKTKEMLGMLMLAYLIKNGDFGSADTINKKFTTMCTEIDKQLVGNKTYDSSKTLYNQCFTASNVAIAASTIFGLAMLHTMLQDQRIDDARKVRVKDAVVPPVVIDEEQEETARIPVVA